MEKLAPQGQLIITGFNHYRDTKKVEEQFLQHRKHYREKHDFELLFTATKGYLSPRDVKAIKALGVQLKPYPNKFLQNIRARFIKTKPAYKYGYFIKSKNF
jgi:hypothetical protein